MELASGHFTAAGLGQGGNVALRMTCREVVFRHPFVLRGFDRVEPAGSYKVETEEESIEDVSFPVWKRLGTVIHVMRGGATEYIRIDPEDLRKALARDGVGGETSAALEVRLGAAQRRELFDQSRYRKLPT